MKTLALIMSLVGSTAFAEAPLSVIPWLNDVYRDEAITTTPNVAPQAHTSGSPTETGQDRMLALHAIATMLYSDVETRWMNSESGNAGKVYGTRYLDHGCKEFKNILLIQSTLPAHEEVMEACPGGGNSNTWIIDNRWHISIAFRFGDGVCQTWFTDAKLDRGRMTGEAVICLIEQDGIDDHYFNVEG